jgi:hypothetical protein
MKVVFEARRVSIFQFSVSGKEGETATEIKVRVNHALGDERRMFSEEFRDYALDGSILSDGFVSVKSIRVIED